MNTKRIKLGILLTGLAVAPVLRADEVEVKGKINTDTKDQTVVEPRRVDRTEVRAEGVRPVNKASGLIGMEVKNNQGEKLGEIKDLVLDMRTGKISYAVLSVGGFLGIGEKLLAVPAAAFTASADEHRLVLNADKEKIRNAPGFAATNWPEVDNPSWGGDKYWTPERTESTIAPAPGIRTEVRTETDRDRAASKLYADARKDRVERYDSNGKKIEVTTSVDADRKSNMTFQGKVKTVNAEERTLTVEGRDGVTRTFYLSESPKLTVGRIDNPSLVDLRVGYFVDVGYHREPNGKLVLHSATRTDR